MATETVRDLPVLYSEAVGRLVACQTIDEAKYYADKSEALAAWAKIHSDKAASVEAKRLKLHAYRRMGELAKELRPRTYFGKGGSSSKGAHSLLQEKGFSRHEAQRMTAITRIPVQKFTKLIESGATPAAASRYAPSIRSNKSGESYRKLMLEGQGASTFRSFTRKNPAKELAKGMSFDEAEKCREVVVELQEWLDEFEQNLPRT